MDLRVLVLTKDLGLAELLRTQVENLGGACTVRETYDELSRRSTGPTPPSSTSPATASTTSTACGSSAHACGCWPSPPTPRQEDAARSAGADEVLVEPFAIADIVDADPRRLGPMRASAQVIDLRHR